jgi:hypothetical protein
MSTYIQNYGITKTLIKKNKKTIKNEIKWIGNYDGNNANIKLAIDNNGTKNTVDLQLDNNELMNLLGVQTIEIPLEQRLINDFLTEQNNDPYEPITLDGIIKHPKHKKQTMRNKQNKYKKHKSLKKKKSLHY